MLPLGTSLTVTRSGTRSCSAPRCLEKHCNAGMTADHRRERRGASPCSRCSWSSASWGRWPRWPSWSRRPSCGTRRPSPDCASGGRLRSARETAISQRRNVEFEFIGLTAIQTVRQDIGTNGEVTGTTVLSTVELENNLQFRLEPGFRIRRMASAIERRSTSGRRRRACSRARARS